MNSSGTVLVKSLSDTCPCLDGRRPRVCLWVAHSAAHLVLEDPLGYSLLSFAVNSESLSPEMGSLRGQLCQWFQSRILKTNFEAISEPIWD